MFRVSQSAAALLREIQLDSEGFFHGGVRIAGDPDDDHSIRLAFRQEPQAGDETFEYFGMRFFVAGETIDYLSDTLLDVRAPTGIPELTLLKPPPPRSH